MPYKFTKVIFSYVWFQNSAFLTDVWQVFTWTSDGMWSEVLYRISVSIGILLQNIEKGIAVFYFYK